MRHLWLAALMLLVCASRTTANQFDLETYTLARVCVAEATFYLPDCAPIAEALRNRARSRGDDTIVPMAKAYSAVFEGTSRRKSWVLALPNGFDKPADWPEHLQRWDTVKRGWRHVVRYASHLVHDKPRSQCEVPVWHWGARSGIDDRRAQRKIREGRWAVVECGNTKNRFYTVTRLHPDKYASN